MMIGYVVCCAPKKICVKSMTILDVCGKMKTQVNSTICYLHIIYLILYMPQIVIFLLKLYSCTRYNITYTYVFSLFLET
jgi:hypothetical protein